VHGQFKILLPAEDRDACAIGELWRKARQSLSDSNKYYLACGQALIAKKKELGHGKWLPWLKANAGVLGFENITVVPQRLMRAANSTLTLNLDDPATAVAINRQLHGNHVHRGMGSGNNEWGTPGEYLDAVRDVLGEIDLDPASSEIAQRTVNAARFYTKADNGLTKEWRGKVWLNPPYAHPEIVDFVAKLIAEYQAGHVTEAILLTHNCTDTHWFHQALRAACLFCLPRGRIQFIDPESNRTAPPNGQAFFYFGNRLDAFDARFSEIGFVAVSYNQSPPGLYPSRYPNGIQRGQDPQNADAARVC
jgi:phage N-6-adenine-methyltransferase